VLALHTISLPRAVHDSLQALVSGGRMTQSGRLAGPIIPLEGRDYLMLDDRVRAPKAIRAVIKFLGFQRTNRSTRTPVGYFRQSIR